MLNDETYTGSARPNLFLRDHRKTMVRNVGTRVLSSGC